MTKFSRIFTVIYTLSGLIVSVAESRLNLQDANHFAAAVCETAAGALLLLLCAFLMRNCFGKTDRQTTLKLLPFVFTPVFLLSTVKRVLIQLFRLFVQTEDRRLDASLSAAGALVTGALGLWLLPKLCRWYASVLEEKGNLLFPTQYRLRHKWWFYLTASLFAGVCGGLLTILTFTGVDFFLSPLWSGLQSPLSEIITLLLLIGFFRLAFRNIDRDTRPLFYLHLTGVAGFSYLSSRLLSVISQTAMSNTIGIFSEASSYEMTALLRALLPVLGTGVLLLLISVIELYGLYCTLRVYEEQLPMA